MAKIEFIPFILLFLFVFCSPQQQDQTMPVLSGLEVLEQEDFSALAGKRIGLVTNHTAITRDGRLAADMMASSGNVNLTALFGPEHGVRGNSEAGATIGNETDPLTGIPAYSLYGSVSKPTAEMLANVDVLVFDIQDVGARFYTYISTLFLTLEAAAELKIPYVVLDRPNPIGGHIVEGPVLDPAFKSFVGIHELPIRHGMTVGELAMMFNGEQWLKNGVKANLSVIKVQEWNRNMLFDETRLPWVKPSPNMVNLQTALLYPGTCLVEATNMSEGRGTQHPFEIIGAPWLNATAVASVLNSAKLIGVKVDTVSFTPVDIPDMATNNKHDNVRCNGLRFQVTDPHSFQAVQFGLHLLAAIRKQHPDLLIMREASMNRLLSDSVILQGLQQGVGTETLWQQAQADLEPFLVVRAKYLLY